MIGNWTVVETNDGRIGMIQNVEMTLWNEHTITTYAITDCDKFCAQYCSDEIVPYHTNHQFNDGDIVIRWPNKKICEIVSEVSEIKDWFNLRTIEDSSSNIWKERQFMCHKQYLSHANLNCSTTNVPIIQSHFEVGDIVLMDNSSKIGLIVDIPFNNTCRIEIQDGRQFLRVQDEIKFYYETHPFEINDAVIMRWPVEKKGQILNISSDGLRVELGHCGSNQWVSIKRLIHDQSVSPLEVSIDNCCKDCHGTGRILLLNSYVECKCRLAAAEEQ